MLFEHHERLALKNGVTMQLIHEFCRDHVCEPAREVEIVQYARRLIRALVVLSAGAAAEADDEFAIPAWEFAGSRIGDDGDSIDRSIDRARLDTHDVGDDIAVVGLRAG